MKLKTLSIFALSGLFIAACSESASTETAEETTPEEPTVEAVTYSVNLAESDVNWRGEVVGVYGHEGTIDLQSGTVVVEGDQIVGGEFVIDMNTIWPTDSASFKDEEGRRATDLVGHLSTDDFFASEMYPTSKFVITSVEGNSVTGDLTVRDKTHSETFNITSMEKTDNGMTMSGTLVFDRQKYDVAWVHYMKDMVLSDDIALKINLVAAAK